MFESELLAEKHFLTDPENTVSIGCGTGLFEERHGIPRGVEPAEGMARRARRRGIDVRKSTFPSVETRRGGLPLPP